MSKPNWINWITNNPKKSKLVVIGAGVVCVAFVALFAIPSEGQRKGVEEKAEEATQKPGQMASRDQVITGVSRENRREVIQLKTLVTTLKDELDKSNRQLDLLKKKGSGGELSVDDIRKIARREVANNRPASQPTVTPRPERDWQRIGPATTPSKPQASAPPTPRWVTIPAGSTARAFLDDGLAWIADNSVRYHKIRIASVRTPNDKEIPLMDCHVMMQSHLEIATEVVARLPLRGDVLSCVLPDNEPIEVSFKGYAKTSDNVQGVEVKVFSNDWDVLKEFGKAAIPVSLARAIDGATSIATTPLGTVTQEGASGLTDIAAQMSGFYLENARVFARKVFWVSPHQEIYVTFRRQVQLKDVTAERLVQSSTSFRRSFN